MSIRLDRNQRDDDEFCAKGVGRSPSRTRGYVSYVINQHEEGYKQRVKANR
jgi:hypothetical protein